MSKPKEAVDASMYQGQKGWPMRELRRTVNREYGRPSLTLDFAADGKGYRIISRFAVLENSSPTP